ncbi:MAPEG family [Aspergillus sp. HF37]|nr:MAPEG family [Aspergillus sp. HF37]
MTPQPRASEPVAGGGLHVFDSKRKLSSHDAADSGHPHSGQSREVNELRGRVQYLENALSLPGPVAIPTPETHATDGGGGGSRLAPEDELVRQNIDAAPEKYFRGRNSRTRYVGRCHWTLLISFFRDIGVVLERVHRDETKDSCTRAVKQFKAEMWSQQRQNHQRAYQEQAFRLEEMMPPRGVVDDLVWLYLGTFETTHRILHVPTFLREYEAWWSGAQSVDTVFLAKLLAMMAAGSCFYDQTTKINGKDSVQKAAGEWIMGVQSWIASVFVSPSIDFNMLQVQCLLTIACQANGAEGDVVWISTGSLVRAALAMGLHRDVPNVSRFWAEMRRRLWATICELELQSSLDGGMPPTIDLDECDCGHPSDWDDKDLSEDMVDDPMSQPLARSSPQVLLARSLPVRSRIVKLFCGLKFGLTYDEALRLNEELAQSMNEVLSVFRSGPTAGTTETAFAESSLIFLLRKYQLVLHHPFFINALCSPKFSYSRKVCVESSMEMLSQIKPRDPGRPKTPCLGDLGGEMLRNEFFRAATTLCVEMSLQAEELERSALSPAGSLADLVRSQRSVMLQAVERTIDVFEGLVGPEGKGSRAFIFLTMALASVRARLTGDDPLRRVEEASLTAVRKCKELMGMSTETQDRSQVSHLATGPVDPGAGAAVGPTPWAPDLIGISPLDFGNLMDIYDYGMPELWESGFFTGSGN